MLMYYFFIFSWIQSTGQTQDLTHKLLLALTGWKDPFVGCVMKQKIQHFLACQNWWTAEHTFIVACGSKATDRPGVTFLTKMKFESTLWDIRFICTWFYPCLHYLQARPLFSGTPENIAVSTPTLFSGAPEILGSSMAYFQARLK